MKLCCPCDELMHPAKPEIAAGLPALPRQLAGFPEYRLAMLRDIPAHTPLSGWRAREGDDLGIMLLEMWAYVLDVLGFYDERIANESYLRTAVRNPSLRKLVGLIGYRPRPALAASVILAAIAEGNRPVKLPPRTAFRSDAFDDEPPQVFETEFEHTIHPLKNEWGLGPVRDTLVGDELLLDPATASISTGQLAILRWTRAGSTELQARHVADITRIEALDGDAYLRMRLDEPLDLDPAAEIDAVEVLTPSLNASPNRTEGDRVTRESIVLDAIYPVLSEQDPVVIQRGKALRTAAITAVAREFVAVSPAEEVPKLPATHITIDPMLPREWTSDPTRLIIHFQMVSGGRLTRIAKTHLDVDDFAAPGIPIEGVVEPLPPDVAAPARLLLLDAVDNGALAEGSVSVAQDGAGAVKLKPALGFDPALRTPVTAFGNLVEATRGESVFNEVLGSGAASQAFQSFTLASNPLTYRNDPSGSEGRRNTLEVRVNGIKWKEVPSFFGAKPHDEVYIVRQNDDEETIVAFGDGVTGSRLPSGVDNVTATYRFGAGAAKPPAGAISQLAKPVDGLRRVVNPVAAGGGADADRPKDLRRNAPNSALILGRAVSVQDFEALAREFGGVINAHVEWAWDETSQGAVVKVWFISDGGDIAKGLKAFLIGQADPTTPLDAEEAEAQPSKMVIDLEIDPRFNGQAVVEQVRQTLTDSESGILAVENIPIGQPLFRSRVFDSVLMVKGARSVRAMTVDGDPAPFAITVAHGRYRDFLDGLMIGSAKAS